MNSVVKVTAAILIKNHKVLITQRGPKDRLAGQWEFPGGKIEAGETAQQCLARELLEELNINVSVGRHLGSHVHHYDHICIELIAFEVKIIGGDLKLNEHADHCWVGLNELDHFEFCAADMFLVQLLKKKILRD